LHGSSTVAGAKETLVSL